MVYNCVTTERQAESTCTFYRGGDDRCDKDVLIGVQMCDRQDRLRQKVHACFTLEVMTGVTKISSLVYRWVTDRQV